MKACRWWYILAVNRWYTLPVNGWYSLAVNRWYSIGCKVTALKPGTLPVGRDGAEARPFVLPKVIPRRPAPTP